MKVRKQKGIAIIDPSGWLMGGKETDDFETMVRQLLEQGNRCLIVDLAGVVHMNSTALGKLIGFHKAYREVNGRMKLCNLDSRIQNVIVISKLSSVFDVYASERTALASFAAGECPES